MKTAKDLAYKAYCDSIKEIGTITDEGKIKERFENWWKEWYHREDHKDSFHHVHSVFIDLKSYIQAE
jgi:hypothetical protein